jgi:hypothetical protein
MVTMPTVLPNDPSRINPELTLSDTDPSEVHLPPDCPPLHPDLVADTTVAISPDETPEAVSGGDMITLGPDDLTESIPLQEPSCPTRRST